MVNDPLTLNRAVQRNPHRLPAQTAPKNVCVHMSLRTCEMLAPPCSERRTVIRKTFYAVLLIGIGVALSQMAGQVTAATAARVYASREGNVATVPLARSGAVSIPTDLRGHFQTDGTIDGKPVSFMVDTGSSVVALNETSAAALGMRPTPADYNATVGTANGSVRAARARLGTVDVGGVVVRDVDAIVLPDEALKENLLGLSFLSKITRLEFANGKLKLEQ
jgi:aspartyl protease family protein